MANEKTNEQFKHDMAIARGYVSAELKKHNIDIDVRLLTTISVLTSVALKYIKQDISAEEARSSFDNAISMYRNNNLPFKDGTTSKQYRAVEEFIAEAWEKYHHEGAKGFSKAFQEVLDAITEAFRQVYKSLTGVS